MKELSQVAGVRRWTGDEFIELQGEPLAAVQGLLQGVGSCILNGCVVSGTIPTVSISAGMVAIAHADGFKISRYAGGVVATLPAYLIASKSQTTKVYDDLGTKLAANIYTATVTTTQPVIGDYITLTAAGGKRFSDLLNPKPTFTATSSITAVKFDKSLVNIADPQSPVSNSIVFTYDFTGAVVGSVVRLYFGLNGQSSTYSITFPAGTLKTPGTGTSYAISGSADVVLMVEFTYWGQDINNTRIVTAHVLATE